MCFKAFGHGKNLKNMILKNHQVQKVRTRTELTVRVRFRFGNFVWGSGSGSDKRGSEPDWTELRQRYVAYDDLLGTPPCSECLHREKCALYKLATGQGYRQLITQRKSAGSGAHTLKLWWDRRWLKETHCKGMCAPCSSACMSAYESARGDYWDKIPSAFNLPSWEELKSLRETNFGEWKQSTTGGNPLWTFFGRVKWWYLSVQWTTFPSCSLLSFVRISFARKSLRSTATCSSATI